MAKTTSAKKAHRVSLRRRVFNGRRKKTMKDAVRDVTKFITAKKTDDGIKALPDLYRAIDKAAKYGTIRKNTASRMKSRITKRLAVAAK